MNEIKAFVGHSFTDDDAGLVLVFLKYFDQLKGALPHFSWEHAEAAEPRELATKVLKLIDDKNVFIAICTKKEQAVKTSALSSFWLSPAYWKAKRTEFQSKTSDWIIQEIGLAIGRKLELVLLVEEGLRSPGGLQGNIEYISFDRTAPEKSFGKITEMISALAPRVSPSGVLSSDREKTDPPLPKSPNTDVEDWMSPDPSWGLRDYRFAIFSAIIGGTDDDQNRINSAFLSTPLASDQENNASWEAHKEFVRIKHGKGGSLERLRRLADEHAKNSAILGYLAYSYSHYGDHANSAKMHEAAAKSESNIERANYQHGRAAVEFARADSVPAARAIIERLKSELPREASSEGNLLSVIREVASITNDDDALVASMERVVELTPDDNDTRFSLALKHSEMGNSDLALLHYLRIPYMERNQSEWNNLGVSFDNFSMPGKAVDAYKRSKEMGETLAMSNLAGKFMSAGLLAEARIELESALKVGDYHRNVGHSLVTLKDIPENENKIEEEALLGAKPKSVFYSLLGRAISEPDLVTLRPRWRAPESKIEVTVIDRKFTATGTYEVKSAILLGLLGGNTQPRTFQLKYDGTIVGRTIEGFVRRTDLTASPQPSLLGEIEGRTKALMVFEEATSELKVLENPHGSNPKFYSLFAAG